MGTHPIDLPMGDRDLLTGVAVRIGLPVSDVSDETLTNINYLQALIEGQTEAPSVVKEEITEMVDLWRLTYPYYFATLVMPPGVALPPPTMFRKLVIDNTTTINLNNNVPGHVVVKSVPQNADLIERLVALAKKRKVPIQIDRPPAAKKE